MSHEKCSKKAIKPLKKELKVYQKNGIQLFMDGKVTLRYQQNVA